MFYPRTISLLTLAFSMYGAVPTFFSRRAFHSKRPSGSGKVIYLTFDDGPNAEYTGKLLDLLRLYHIHATFFSVAEFAEENPELIRRIREEGHLIGMHSCRHQDAWINLRHDTRLDFDRSLQIFDELGVHIGFYRPPWGKINLFSPSNVQRNHLHMVYWDVMAEDWRANTTSGTIARKLLRRAHENDIVCLHDGRGRNGAPARTIEALEKVLPIWIEQGYSFATLDELYENEDDETDGPTA